MNAPTVGWVGIGFAPGTNMVNADLIVVGKADDGSSYIYVCIGFYSTNVLYDCMETM